MNAKIETRSISLEYDLPYPPAKVWRALTEPRMVGEGLPEVLARALELRRHRSGAPRWARERRANGPAAGVLRRLARSATSDAWIVPRGAHRAERRRAGRCGRDAPPRDRRASCTGPAYDTRRCARPRWRCSPNVRATGPGGSRSSPPLRWSASGSSMPRPTPSSSSAAAGSRRCSIRRRRSCGCGSSWAR